MLSRVGLIKIQFHPYFDNNFDGYTSGRQVANHRDGRTKQEVLRITTEKNSEATRFIVEGKLAGPCVCELEKCWTSFISREAADRVVIDLTSVTYVDSSGKELLARMFQEGTRFTGKLLMPKSIIQEIECGQEQRKAS